MPRTWRLLRDGPASGPWNMGVDEALLASAAAGGGATLRLYAWRGPWLSLGYGQALAAQRREACDRAGVAWVRRATGGRAVLHGRDLTYALAAPEAWLPEGLRATYDLLAEALGEALRALGVAAVRAPAAPGPAGAGFDCFAEPAQDELCVGGRKLVGSAQRRVQGGVLQHGSIRLAPDPVAARRAVGISGAGATSLAEVGVEAGAAGARLVESFSRALGARFEPGRLAPRETAAAAGRGRDPASPAVISPQGDPQGPLPSADR